MCDNVRFSACQLIPYFWYTGKYAIVKFVEKPLAPPHYSPTAVWWREDYMGPLCWKPHYVRGNALDT